MSNELYLLKDLAEKIEASARGFGLKADDFTLYLVTEEQMLAPWAFSGGARRYAHWSFGKKAEIFANSMKEGGVSISTLDLPLLYGMPRVPILASAPLYKQVSAIARAYAYSDFMAKSGVWKERDLDEIRRGLEAHADLVANLKKHPLVDGEKVERTLNAAHALAYQCSHNSALSGRTDDLLMEIAKNSPGLEKWQRDLFRIAHEEWVWFLPFIETYFMSKGWVSFWGKRLIEDALQNEIMEIRKLAEEKAKEARNKDEVSVIWEETAKNTLRLDELRFRSCSEFENEVSISRKPGPVNIPSVGYRIFESIFKEKCGENIALFVEKSSEILRDEGDISFIEKYLTRETAESSGLWSYGQRGKSGGDEKVLEIKDLSDSSGWESVRDELIGWIGGNAFPLIRITENIAGKITLEHQFEGRPLNMDEDSKGALSDLRSALHREAVLIYSTLDASGKETKTKAVYNAQGGYSSASLNAPAQNQGYGCGD